MEILNNMLTIVGKIICGSSQAHWLALLKRQKSLKPFFASHPIFYALNQLEVEPN